MSEVPLDVERTLSALLALAGSVATGAMLAVCLVDALADIGEISPMLESVMAAQEIAVHWETTTTLWCGGTRVFFVAGPPLGWNTLDLPEYAEIDLRREENT